MLDWNIELQELGREDVSRKRSSQECYKSRGGQEIQLSLDVLRELGYDRSPWIPKATDAPILYMRRHSICI